MFRYLGVALLGVLPLTLTAADDKPAGSTFKKEDVGKVPSGWTAAKTGTGTGSVWKVVADATAPSKSGLALAQTAVGDKPVFNLCILNDSTLQDGEVSVAFKAIKGEVDQGGGLVWRYQDADNYYVARMNPLESNYRLYKVVAGKRVQLATTKEEVAVKDGAWTTLKIKQTGEQIECWLNDKKYLEAKDDTFAKAGKVGLWTKADAQTHFDSLTISAAKK